MEQTNTEESTFIEEPTQAEMIDSFIRYLKTSPYLQEWLSDYSGDKFKKKLDMDACIHVHFMLSQAFEMYRESGLTNKKCFEKFLYQIICNFSYPIEQGAANSDDEIRTKEENDKAENKGFEDVKTNE